MIKKLRYLFTLMLLFVASVGWGGTYIMTPDKNATGLSNTSYITSLTEFSYNGVKWKMNQWNPSTLQVKTNQSSATSEFRFYNTTAFAGKILKVVIKFSDLTVSDENGFMFIGGSSEVSGTDNGTPGIYDADSKTITWTPESTSEFTFFAFYQNGKVASGTNKLALENAITVTYEGEGGETPVTPDYQTVTLPYEETFDSNIGKFVIEDTNLPEDLTYVWNHDSYGYMKASAFKSNTAYASESWLISPIIDLTENTGNADFSFDHATNHFTSVQTAAEEATVWVREESGEWSKLNNITYPESLGWTFVSSGTVDLSSYNGKKIQIGFKYVSTAEKAGTWEVKNVKIGQVKAEPELSFSANSYTATLGEDNTFPELQNPNNLDVTYRVAKESVATIDETTGEITLVAAGQTTVYAEFAGNDEYKEGSASYTLIVKEKSIAGSDKFELVTDASTLAAGDIIILVGSDKGSYYALGTTQNSNNRAAEAVSIETDGTIIPGSTVQQITLEEGWYFNVGSGYLYAASSSSNHLKTEANADDNAKATIVIADGDATITFQGTNTRNILRYNPNNNNPIFSCYASSSTAGSLPKIYRKVKDAETVTIGEAKYATYVAPFNCTIAKGVTVYKVKAIGESNVTLEEVTEAIPAGAAVVVNGEKGEYAVTKAESASELTGNLLKAATRDMEYTEGNFYVLANKSQVVGFYHVTSGTIAKGKGYLVVADAGAPAKDFYGFGGDETGINDINVNVNANDAIYSISGQRLQKLQRGINIVNGKKIVVK